MKKLMLIVGLLVAANILFAQGRRDAMNEKAEIRIEEYKERLNLDEDQLKELKALKESIKPELDAIRNDESKARSEKMRAHADLVEKRETEVARILNDEQMAELEVIKKEMREKMEKRMRERKKRRDDGR